MKVAIITALTLGAVLMPQLPSSLDTRFGQEITISSPVNGDIYLAGSRVTIDAPIRGDLVVAAGTVIINDSIMQDILVAGGNIMVNGYVGDDIRAAAGSITLSGNVNGDVVSGNGELILKEPATINGNLTTSGGVLDIFGHVKGNMHTVSEELKFGGTVDGELNAQASEMEISGTVNGYAAISAKTINVAQGASFKKDVRYWNDDGSLNISRETNDIKVTYDPSIKVEQERWELLGYSSVLMALWYLGTALVVILLIEYLFSKTLLNAAGVALQRSLGSLGFGIVFYIGVPVVCLALLVTILAIPIAIILIIAYIIVVVSATAITAVVISNWLNRVYYSSSWSVGRIGFVAFGIFVILKFFTLTPFVGPLVMAVLACMAMGAIAITVWNARTKKTVKS